MLWWVYACTDFVLGSRGPLLISLRRRLKAFLPSLPVLAPIDHTNPNKNAHYSSERKKPISAVFCFFFLVDTVAVPVSKPPAVLHSG